MFHFFVFLNNSFSFLRHCCLLVFRCSFPTPFRQFSPIFLPFYPIFWFVCILCRSLSFLRKSPFFVLSVVLSLPYVTSLYLSLDVVFPLYFVNSLRLCLPFLSFFLFLTSVLSLLCL